MRPKNECRGTVNAAYTRARASRRFEVTIPHSSSEGRYVTTSGNLVPRRHTTNGMRRRLRCEILARSSVAKETSSANCKKADPRIIGFRRSTRIGEVGRATPGDFHWWGPKRTKPRQGEPEAVILLLLATKRELKSGRNSPARSPTPCSFYTPTSVTPAREGEAAGE